MKKTTLCYLTHQNDVLMILRNKKKNDENKDKYIGLGGHFLPGETPEECVIREVFEESGINLSAPRYCGIVTFHSDIYPSEEMHLFSKELQVRPILPACNEGTLCFLSTEQLFSVNMWEGDRIFLSLLFENAPFFHLTLRYEGENLISATLNDQKIK